MQPHGAYGTDERMTESRATAIGAALTNGYRSDGLRAWKQHSTTKIWFLYDGKIAVCELNSSGAVTATNTVGPFGLLARNSGGSTVLYGFDEAGNTAERLSTSGTVLSQTYTDAFGASAGSVSSDPYSGYGGQWRYYTDSETGLTLCGHRFYDTGVGRWLNRDPAGYGGGINLYGYCTNNPILSKDPSGLLPPCCHGDPDDACDPYAPPLYPPGQSPQNSIQQTNDIWAHSLWGCKLPGVTDSELIWLGVMQHTGGKWDFKDQGSSKNMDYDAAGNFNYGAVGADLGFPANLLLRGGGVAQMMDGKDYNPSMGHPWGGPPYGDDVPGQQQIQRGIDWYNEHYPGGCPNILSSERRFPRSSGP